MARFRKRKSLKGTHSQESMLSALKQLRQGWSLRKAAETDNVNYQTPRRYHKMTKDTEDLDSTHRRSNFNHRQVFAKEIEEEISDFIKERSRLGYGLTISEVKTLAYDMAKHKNIPSPSSWERNKQAGHDWYLKFRIRHPDLPVRKPESCSVARAAAFNKPVIEAYFKRLGDVLQRNPRFADGSRVFNLDETATSTVPTTKQKLMAVKGAKQVHHLKSQERGGG